MNDTFSNNQNDEQIVRLLNRIAETTQANPYFLDELEQRLRDVHKPKRNWFAFTLRRLSPTVGWVGLLLLLGFILNWTIRSLIPVSQPTSINPLGGAISTPSLVTESVRGTSVPEDAGYDWRGTTLFLSAQLPASPAEANVYVWTLNQPVTLDEARVLAQRFAINAEPEEIPGELPGYSDYTVTDGVQRLRLRSDHYFTYHTNAEELYLENLTEEQARSVTDVFLKKYGFDFEYKFERAPEMQGQNFYILPLVPGGHEIRFDHLMPTWYEITLDNTGENIILSGYWMDYEELRMFEIISAEEAFEKLLNPNPQTGLMEIFRGQGGGGGGGSFLKLNLSGTPVPFPSEVSSANPNEEILGSAISGISMTLPEQDLVQLEIGDRFEGTRGIFQVNIYETSRRIWYGFFETSADKGNMPYVILNGDNLRQLHKYNNLPLNIWGTVDHFDQMGRPVIKVDRYEIPFPDLRYQIVEGSQKLIEIQGQKVLTFITNDGTQYIQIISAIYPMSEHAMFANEGDKLLAEALIVPDETFGGYPAIRINSIGYAVDPISGKRNKLDISMTEFGVYADPVPSFEIYSPPTATIEKVDLVFYVRYPPHALLDILAGTQYLQPAWRFYGHYSNGDEFEIMVQALKQEFLFPELAPYTPPG